MSATYHIRLAQLDDAKAVTALLTTCYENLMAPLYAPDVWIVVGPLFNTANPALLSSGTWFVAETIENQLVGCGGWTPEDPATGTAKPGIGMLRHFATDPACTKQGIGRTIFDACCQQARQQGITTFECYSSLYAEKFYQALGLKTIKPHTLQFGDDTQLPVIFMTTNMT